MSQPYSSLEKLKILKEGEKAGVSVAEVCRRYQIPTTTYFTWRKQAEEALKQSFQNGNRALSNAQKEAREKQKIHLEIRRLRAVIAEITAENLTLKKTLGDF